MHETLPMRPRALVSFHAALAFYDRETASHCARVGQSSTRLGGALGLGERDVEALRWSGLLHDLGKLSLREAILRSDDPLTEDDRVKIKAHPNVGADIVLALSQRFEPIVSGIRSHHERWDGSGYPDGLEGDAIPLAGRIIAIADTYDAMIKPRSYRQRTWTHDEVIDQLETQAHLQFDPHIVAVFVIANHQARSSRTHSARTSSSDRRSVA